MPLYIEAIVAALRDALLDDERVFLLGEDIGHFGGAFGVTKGLWEEFGDERVIDTPISAEGFVGAAVGAAWMGDRPVVELQFADFVSCSFDPIVTVVLSLVACEGFQELDAPPVLAAPPDTPVPFAPELEDAYLPSLETVRTAVEELLAY